jgi:hypothetical protein
MEKLNMEDSSHEQVVDQPTTDSKINRRDMAKLLGAVAALSASLGATFTTSAATVPAESQLKLKFLKQAPNGDPTKAELLFTIDVSPPDVSKIAAADSPVELRVVSIATEKQGGNVMGRAASGQEVTIASQTIPQAAWRTIKFKAN